MKMTVMLQGAPQPLELEMSKEDSITFLKFYEAWKDQGQGAKSAMRMNTEKLQIHVRLDLIVSIVAEHS